MSALAEAWASRGGDDWVAHCRDLDGGGRPHRLALLRALLSFRPVRSVAEVGCGAGANLRLIRLTFPSAALTGVDVNRALAAQAAADVPDARIIVGDLADVPLCAVSVAFSCYALAYVPSDGIRAVIGRMLAAAARGVIFLEPSVPGIWSQYRNATGVPEWSHPYEHIVLGHAGWSVSREAIDPPQDRLNACIVARRAVPFDHNP